MPLNIHILMTQCLSDGQAVSEKHKNFNDQHFLCVEELVLSAVLEQGKDERDGVIFGFTSKLEWSGKSEKKRVRGILKEARCHKDTLRLSSLLSVKESALVSQRK